MTPHNPPLAALHVESDLILYHTGPALDHGPLPSIFYFALSGPDSLGLDPFNQPVRFLHGSMIRVFSLTLPGHEQGLNPTQAISLWAQDYSRGLDPLGYFLDRCEKAVEFAIKERFIDPDKLAVAGLSRGGLIAFHLAARMDLFRFILAFAPLTKLSLAKEFAELQNSPAVSFYNTENLVPTLTDRHTRIYIGNRDTRVATRSCFDFAERLADTAYEQKIRSPQVELFITPSIGQYGHGTSPDTFKQGADWLASCLKK